MIRPSHICIPPPTYRSSAFYTTNFDACWEAVPPPFSVPLSLHFTHISLRVRYFRSVIPCEKAQRAEEVHAQQGRHTGRAKQGDSKGRANEYDRQIQMRKPPTPVHFFNFGAFKSFPHPARIFSSSSRESQHPHCLSASRGGTYAAMNASTEHSSASFGAGMKGSGCSDEV